MRWPRIPLREVAPAEPARSRFAQHDVVWHLTLDQIESNTGYVVNKRMAPVSEAGSSTYVFDEGNVLYSKLRPYLNKVIAPNEKGVATTELVPLRPRSKRLDRHFLTYYLRSRQFMAFANLAVAGVKMPRIIMAKFWKHPVPVPPLSEQQRIVEILDQANVLRRKRAEADSKAARILSALFYKLFGDPATNPKGWPIKTLGELSVNGPQYGANAKAVDYQEGAPRYVRITDITDDGRLGNGDVRSLDLDDWEAYRLIEGDLLFARSGATVGKTYLYLPEDGLCAYAGYLIRFQLDRSAIDPWVVFAFTQTQYYRSWVAFKRRTAAQPNINGQEYASLTMPQPDSKSQDRFVKSAREFSDLYAKKAKASGCIEELFSLLLHRAFSGNLTAKWREGHMTELLAEIEQQNKGLAN